MHSMMMWEMRHYDKGIEPVWTTPARKLQIEKWTMDQSAFPVCDMWYLGQLFDNVAGLEILQSVSVMP